MAREYTLESFHEDYQNQAITMATLQYKSFFCGKKNHAIVLPEDLLTQRYQADLKKIVTKRDLTEEEERTYWYNPKRLSYDMYGSTEYWRLLLELNQMYSCIEFCINPLLVYTQALPNLIQAMVNLEQPFYDSSEELIRKQVDKVK